MRRETDKIPPGHNPPGHNVLWIKTVDRIATGQRVDATCSNRCCICTHQMEALFCVK